MLASARQHKRSPALALTSTSAHQHKRSPALVIWERRPKPVKMPPASSCYDGADNTKGWRGLYNAQPLWKAGSIFKVNPTSLLQAIPLLDIYAKETKMWDFPGSPVVKSFHGRRHGSQGTKTPHDLAKKIENVRPQSLQE